MQRRAKQGVCSRDSGLDAGPVLCQYPLVVSLRKELWRLGDTCGHSLSSRVPMLVFEIVEDELGASWDRARLEVCPSGM
jgi:hypothetical protein